MADEAVFRGHLGENLVHFGRALRAAGLPIGTGQILDATRAVAATGVEARADLYHALAACFVRRREELAVFDEAFELFFRDPGALNKALALLVERSAALDLGEKKPDAASRRVREALARQRAPEPVPPREESVELDLLLTASSDETLRTRDFEQMSAEEIARARDAIRRMTLPHATVPTRRLGPEARGGRLDIRRTLRATLRAGGDAIPLRFRGPRERPAPIVALCDVSGSMERYSRMVLHFLHALTRDRARVESFVFGTRLTNVTRRLRSRDVDAALAAVGNEVTDWSGGTRIGDSVRAFNKLWSRRVLGQGAVVLLITDGLERGDVAVLGREMDRLRRSCRWLVWLNPLLRYEGFEPRAAGIRAMIDHVDDLRTVHHLASLEDLARSLGAPAPRRTLIATR